MQAGTLFNPKLPLAQVDLFGKGYLNGTQSHLHFLPEGHTDLLIPSYSEEFGLIGIIILFSLYLAIILRTLQIQYAILSSLWKIARRWLRFVLCIHFCKCRNRSLGVFTCNGYSFCRFMSYGGTAIITLMASFGIVMSIYTHK